jgi:hypothetical protein
VQCSCCFNDPRKGQRNNESGPTVLSFCACVCVDDRRAVAVLFLILKQQAKKRGGNQNKQRKRAASRSVFDGHEEKKAI